MPRRPAEYFEFCHWRHINQTHRIAHCLALPNHVGGRIEPPITPDISRDYPFWREPEWRLPSIACAPNRSCLCHFGVTRRGLRRTARLPLEPWKMNPEVMAEVSLFFSPTQALLAWPPNRRGSNTDISMYGSRQQSNWTTRFRNHHPEGCHPTCLQPTRASRSSGAGPVSGRLSGGHDRSPHIGCKPHLIQDRHKLKCGDPVFRDGIAILRQQVCAEPGGTPSRAKCSMRCGFRRDRLAVPSLLPNVAVDRLMAKDRHFWQTAIRNVTAPLPTGSVGLAKMDGSIFLPFGYPQKMP